MGAAVDRLIMLTPVHSYVRHDGTVVKDYMRLEGPHYTTAEAATAIKQGGFKVGSGIAAFGRGVYIALDETTVNHYRQRWGEKGSGSELQVSADLPAKNVLVIGPTNRDFFDEAVVAALKAKGKKISYGKWRMSGGGSLSTRADAFLKLGIKAIVVQEKADKTNPGLMTGVIFDPTLVKVTG